MGGEATKLGPFTGGLHNSSGTGEFIENEELFELNNLEVDTDGSLVNRPQISIFTTTGWDRTGARMLGTYLPNDGRKFVIAYSPVDGKVHCINTSTGAVAASSTGVIKAFCCIQYANRVWVIATNDSIANGGYFDVPTSSTTTWTAVPTMARGEAVCQYRERLWVACGVGATSNTSRFYFSGIGDPSVAWNVNDYVDVAAGNGQKLVDLKRMGQDIILFKEHSTHKFTYTTDPRKAELNELDPSIGTPSINSTALYNNNVIYVLHDNSVYEMFQYTYTRISTMLNMEQVTDLDLFTPSQYGLSIHRDRLFVRYFSNMYVYSLKVKRWSRWITARKFSYLVTIPSSVVGLDTAYACSASQATATEVYWFQDNKSTVDGGNNEVFKCRIVTKTYDFDVPQSYKASFWVGISLATSGTFRTEFVIPNASPNVTYRQAQALYGSWAAGQTAGRTWASNTPVEIPAEVTPTLGGYARKFIKLFKKVRFRQMYMKFEFDVVSNGGIADASLRVYDLTIFLRQKEGVVKETS